MFNYMRERHSVNSSRRFRAVMLSLLVTLLLVVPAATRAQASPGQLYVTGQAVIKAEPDMAIFSVGVDVRAETVEAARQENAEAMEGIRNRLLALGVDESNLKTKGFNVHPEWHYDNTGNPPTLVGYRVAHTLEVTVIDLDKLGLWLDAAMEEGANQISGPTFGLQDTRDLEATALREAVKRARAKANVLAEANGVFLKRIAHISEQVSLPAGGAVNTQYMAMDTMAKSATSISPGEVSATATVMITYDLTN